ncbi:MAG TPA: DUF748 domain-containing protein [Flavobacteriales bacterium]
MTTPAEAPRRPKWKRRLLIGGIVLVLALCVVAFFLPYLLKRYIEKHSVEWIDRQITIDYLILNPFTFKYGLYGVKCTEPKGSTETFVSWKEISTRSNLWKGFQENNWRFTAVRIVDPYVHLTQQGDRFNFSDLMELGGGDSTAVQDTTASDVRFSMEDIRISGGRIDYDSDVLKAPVTIEDLRAECTLITSESARMDFDLGFALASGGALDGGFMIDTDRSLYAIDARLKAFALPQLLPYLQDFMQTTALEGSVDLGLDLHDSWADTTALAVRAALDVRALDITDGAGAHLIGTEHIEVKLDTLNAASSTFKLSRVLVDGLDTRYQQWADGSNSWTKALKLETTTSGDSTVTTLNASESNVFVMLADYIRMLGQDFVANQYTADSLVLSKGHVVFEDFTPEKPFRYDLAQVDIRSSRINTVSGTADFLASAQLNGRGGLKSSFRFDPKNFANVQAEMTVTDLALQDFDAYSRWYAAHPLQEGVLNYTGATTIRDGRLDSRNNILVSRLKFGKKTDVHDTGIYVLPLRLATGLLKDVKGDIELEVPVQGDLKDPTFKVWPIVWQVLKNLVVKGASAPVRLVARAFADVDEDDLETVRFGATQLSLEKPQRKSLDMLVKLLQDKPELSVALVPIAQPEQVREDWAALQVKKKFLGLSGTLSGSDSSKVMDLALRDEAFVAYLNEQSPGTKDRSERQRCVALLGAEVVKKAVADAENSRQRAVIAHLKEAGISDKRYTFRAGTKEETAGFIGDPGYRFVFDTAD